MIDICSETKNETLVVRATGILSSADYELHFKLHAERLIAKYGKINVVLHLDENFEGWDLGAMWDDTKFGLQHRHDFHRIAVVGAQVWFKWAMNLGSKFVDGQFMTFEQNDLAGAVAWVNAVKPPAKDSESVAAS